MKTLRRNPMTSQAGNVVRDVLYGRWCKGNRIGSGTVPPFSVSVILLLCSPLFFINGLLAEQISQIRPSMLNQLDPISHSRAVSGGSAGHDPGALNG